VVFYIVLFRIVADSLFPYDTHIVDFIPINAFKPYLSIYVTWREDGRLLLLKGKKTIIRFEHSSLSFDNGPKLQKLHLTSKRLQCFFYKNFI